MAHDSLPFSSIILTVILSLNEGRCYMHASVETVEELERKRNFYQKCKTNTLRVISFIGTCYSTTTLTSALLYTHYVYSYLHLQILPFTHMRASKYCYRVNCTVIS